MSIYSWLNKHLTFYRGGFSIAFLGILQFMIFFGLNDVGIIDIGSGLGPVMIMLMSWFLGGTLVGAGLLVDVIEWVRKRRK